MVAEGLARDRESGEGGGGGWGESGVRKTAAEQLGRPAPDAVGA